MITLTFARKNVQTQQWETKTVTKASYADAQTSITLMKSLHWELWSMHTGIEEVVTNDRKNIYVK